LAEAMFPLLIVHQRPQKERECILINGERDTEVYKGGSNPSSAPRGNRLLWGQSA